MIQDTHITKVIFRKFKKDGTIIAIFPEEIGTSSPRTCLSYMFIGQHSSCNPYEMTAYGTTTLANPTEYIDLFNELTSLGYNLKVIHKLPNDAFTIRNIKLNRKYI